MFSNNFNNYGYANTIPTSTQPYGYPMSNYGMQSMAQPQMPMQPQTNTNKIYVSGIDDVRNRQLPNNSDVIYLDNDKPILYQKVVDGKGQFEVKAFSIVPYSPQDNDSAKQSVDLSNYVKIEDLEPIKSELRSIQEKLSRQGVKTNG